MGSATVLLVDDDSDVRLVARTLIDRSGNGLEVVGEADSGPQALELFARLRPGIVVLDYQMPEMDGLACARELLAIAPDQNMLLLSAYLDVPAYEAATALGVDCLDKDRIGYLPTAPSDRVGGNVTRPLRFAFSHVVLLGARPATGIEEICHAAYATGPCPGCEQRRPLDDAWMLRVRGEGIEDNAWSLLVCAPCVRNNGIDLADDGVRPHRSLAHGV